MVDTFPKIFINI